VDGNAGSGAIDEEEINEAEIDDLKIGSRQPFMALWSSGNPWRVRSGIPSPWVLQ